MKWLIWFLPLIAWANESEMWARRWMTVSEVLERHEGYPDGESIQEPKGTWQLLYSVLRTTHPPNGVSKDCLWVKVPSKDDGEVKIVEVKDGEPCGDSWTKTAVLGLTGLKGLQSRQHGSEAQLWLTQKTGRVIAWKARFLNASEVVSYRLHDSSVPKRQQPGVFFFEPDSSFAPAEPNGLMGELKDQYPPHPCRFTDGSCQRCRFGVYSVPEGDKFSYFCGIDRCGEVNQPACNRGKRWQRTRDPMGCRQDDSYLFCGPGLRVECEGERGICR